MNTILRLECPNCHHWNHLEVEKAFLQPPDPEPKVHVLLPSYLSHKIQKCEKCQTVLAGPDELFRIENDEAVRYRMKDIENDV